MAVSAASNATLVSVTAPTIAGYTGVVRTPGCPRLVRASTLRGTPWVLYGVPPRVPYGVLLRGTRYPWGDVPVRDSTAYSDHSGARRSRGEGGLSFPADKQTSKPQGQARASLQTNKQTNKQKSAIPLNQTNKPRPGQARGSPQTLKQTNRGRAKRLAFPPTSAQSTGRAEVLARRGRVVRAARPDADVLRKADDPCDLADGGVRRPAVRRHGAHAQ